MTHLRFLLMMLLALVASLTPDQARAQASADEQPLLYVVNGAADIDSVGFAVEELATYLPRLTGCRVEQVDHSQWQPGDTPAIVVGQAPENVSLDHDDRDSFRLLSVDDVLYVFGHDDAPGRLFSAASKGTLYGIYHYLRNTYDMRWIMPGADGEVLPPERQALQTTGFDLAEAPAFHQRVLGDGVWPDMAAEYEDDYGITAEQQLELQKQQRLWLLRNGAQTHWFVLAKHAFGDWWEKYHEQHPDWFAMHRNGERTLHGKAGRVKLCVSNPEVIEQAVQQGLEAAARNPLYVSISGSPNDSGLSNFCMCEQCRALDVPTAKSLNLNDVTGSFEYVSLSDRYAWFWSRMAEKLVEERPDLKVAAYAYYATSEPPRRQALHPNVLIGFVQHAASYWDKQTWLAERRKFDGWADKGGKGYWRPNALLIGHGVPSNYLPRLAEDLRHIHDRGVRYVFYDSMIPHWGTMGHTYYVTAHLLWDPERDPEALIDDYLHHAYGSAASDVRTYLDRLEQLTERIFHGGRVDAGLWRPAGEMAAAMVLTPRELDRLENHLHDARAAAADEPGALRRLALLEDGLAFTRLQLAVFRMMYLHEPNTTIDLSAPPAAEAIAARDQWLRDHPQTLAVSVPSVLKNADSMASIINKIRQRLDVPGLRGE